MHRNDFFGRIEKVMDYYHFKSLNLLAKDGLGYSSSEKLNRLKKEGAQPSFQVLLDLTNRFVELNPEWLLNGKGVMLRDIDDGKIDEKELRNIRSLFEMKFRQGIPTLEKFEAARLELTDLMSVNGLKSCFNLNKMVPFFNSVSDYNGRLSYVLTKSTSKLSQIECTDNSAEFAIRIEDDYNEPLISSGATIFGHKVDHNLAVIWGRLYLIDTAEGIILGKVFPKDQQIECKPVNLNYPTKYIKPVEVLSMFLITQTTRNL